MPTITVSVDEELRARMENHPEINWSEVTRQAIDEKIEQLELLDKLTTQSELTKGDIEAIATKINQAGRHHVDRDDP